MVHDPSYSLCLYLMRTKFLKHYIYLFLPSILCDFVLLFLFRHQLIIDLIHKSKGSQHLSNPSSPERPDLILLPKSQTPNPELPPLLKSLTYLRLSSRVPEQCNHQLLNLPSLGCLHHLLLKHTNPNTVLEFP